MLRLRPFLFRPLFMLLSLALLHFVVLSVRIRIRIVWILGAFHADDRFFALYIRYQFALCDVRLAHICSVTRGGHGMSLS